MNNAEEKAAKMVGGIIIDAIENRASDIHLAPLEGGEGELRFRIDGVLRPAKLPSGIPYKDIVRHFKTMCCMNVVECGQPQDGRSLLNVRNQKIDLRISVLPVMFGERVVIRILDVDNKSVVLDLDRCVDNEESRARIRSICKLPHGLIAVTGPTGSGKTTLLYSMLYEVIHPGLAVLSIEDPVEYILEGVSQVGVNLSKGITFPTALRSFLRQDPDVIMVGEIRDLETLNLCAQAALTGHLVFTCMHTDNAPEAVQRLLDIGLPPFLVNHSLKAVVSQRLVRRLCKHCKQEVKGMVSPAPTWIDGLDDMLGDGPFYAPQGCDKCNMGYRGRLAIHEILSVDDALRQAVMDNKGIKHLAAAARQAGMKTLLEDGLAAASRGATSIEEVLRVTACSEII